MKELTDDMLDEILAKSSMEYFIHREDVGEVIITFTSGIRKIEPGDTDSAGRVWNPKIVDENGNPILDRNGKPLEQWEKYEATGMINGVPYVYSFGGKRGSQLKAFILAMKANNIKNEDLPGTKWSINRVNRWDWDIRYLGKDNSTSQSQSNNIDLFRNALKSFETDRTEFTKNEIITYLSFATHLPTSEISEQWNEIVNSGILIQRGDKYSIKRE